ncbi:hypothetical protein SDC9_164743 [bioreactor metagenome]|uniref:Uncharacterized protein n=1 Tax=bioreactor metagenome TaxID=1076179 RepID=A0A645FUG2_9ZZZZ
MHVHRPRFPLKVHAPNAVQQPFSRKRDILVFREHNQKVKFHRLERKLFPVLADGALQQIDGQRSNLQHLSKFPRTLKYLFDAHEQFQHLERLDDIVVRAIAQSSYLALHVVFCREENHGNLRMPQNTQQRKAVHTREHDIQQR